MTQPPQPAFSSVVVYGPPGSGKSHHARALAAYYGKAMVYDNWNGDTPLPRNALVLCRFRPAGAGHFVPIEQALADAQLPPLADSEGA